MTRPVSTAGAMRLLPIRLLPEWTVPPLPARVTLFNILLN